MALYRTGTAAMDAQGVITGTGTKWREPLSLIRTGATIVFLTSPLKLAVISDIVSDTEMKAIQTDGEPVENGNYVILLNDSLTVDGMAQDVAETLRYYQSKETVIEEAIEFFKNFDLKQLQDLVNQIKEAERNTAADRAATEQLKNDTQAIKDSAVSETQQIKDSAVAETNQIKADTDAIKNQTQQIKDSAVTEITGIKNEALDARDEAETAQFAAEQSKVGADNAKAGAETARDEARQWAQQVQPENLLHKDQNLADLADKKKSRQSLEVDRVVQAETSTSLGWVGGYRLAINSSGNWGALNGSNEWIPLAVANGGTGAKNVTQAKINLQIDRVVQGADYTSMFSPDKNHSISVRNDDLWGMWSEDAGWKPLGIQQGGTGGYNQGTARKNLGLGTDDVVWFKGLVAYDITGVGGAWTPVIRKLKDQQTADSNKNNQLSYLENDDMSVTNYIITVPQDNWSIQYVWQLARTGGATTWFSMRSDNGFYTPEGRCAIQGSDVRIKDRFEPPKPGAWDRVKQIGVMEFYYKGNHVLQRGYLAQQMAEIDETYVFFGGKSTDENGEEFEVMNVNDRAVVSDLIVVIQELQSKNEALESEVSDLKSDIEQLKKMVAGLAGGNATTIQELP